MPACRPLLVAAAIAVAGCGALRMPDFVSARAPKAEALQAFLTTRVCGAVLDGKERVARLQIVLDVVRPLPRGALVETEFHDALEQASLTAQRVATGSERAITIASPPLARIRAAAYETVTRVYAAADRKEILGVHTQRCESLVDRRDLGPVFQ